MSWVGKAWARKTQAPLVAASSHSSAPHQAGCDAWAEEQDRRDELHRSPPEGSRAFASIRQGKPSFTRGFTFIEIKIIKILPKVNPKKLIILTFLQPGVLFDTVPTFEDQPYQTNAGCHPSLETHLSGRCTAERLGPLKEWLNAPSIFRARDNRRCRLMKPICSNPQQTYPPPGTRGGIRQRILNRLAVCTLELDATSRKRILPLTIQTPSVNKKTTFRPGYNFN